MIVECRRCHTEYDISVTEHEIQEWKLNGTFIQDAMPDVPAWQREMLISATCDNCWKEMFGDDDDVDD